MNPGHLYIVATPIGNMQDITLRALTTLKVSDIIVCEDTRVTGNLLHHHGISKPMIALNEFNETTIMYDIVQKLELGSTVSLVSDNGTPLISDPGFPLVRLAKSKGIVVTPIPGPSAVIAALSASGLPSDAFQFVGFLPKQASKRKRVLENFVAVTNNSFSPTFICYESPHRIVATLQAMLDVFGDREIVIARELTKIHEELRSDILSVLIDEYSQKQPKGEITLLVSLK